MKENEKMICNQGFALRKCLTDLDMKGIMKKGKKMEKVCSVIIFKFKRKSFLV